MSRHDPESDAQSPEPARGRGGGLAGARARADSPGGVRPLSPPRGRLRSHHRDPHRPLAACRPAGAPALVALRCGRRGPGRRGRTCHRPGPGRAHMPGHRDRSRRIRQGARARPHRGPTQARPVRAGPAELRRVEPARRRPAAGRRVVRPAAPSLRRVRGPLPPRGTRAARPPRRAADRSAWVAASSATSSIRKRDSRCLGARRSRSWRPRRPPPRPSRPLWSCSAATPSMTSPAVWTPRCAGSTRPVCTRRRRFGLERVR